jgi:hypothetical protein
MTREQMWSYRADAAREPSDRMRLLAAAGMLTIGAVGWLWTLVEDTRAWIGR